MSEYIALHGREKYTAYSSLKETGLVRHGFMTRLGGVSGGVYEGLDLSFERGDDRAKVLENFRLAAECFGTDPGHIVAAQQTHTANIRRVSAGDAGKGVTRERDYRDIDGLITDEPGLLLATSHADCTPIFLLDPVNKAVGLVHSGWKGTAARIAAEAIRCMEAEFGTDPGDIIAAIGPCICGSCYEIGPEVAEIFRETFRGEEPPLKAKDNGKYLLDLKAANRRILEAAGVSGDNIDMSVLCTFEREDLFFSHRKMGARRGQMAAFMMLVK